MISKGSTVTIRTNNGGETTGVLVHDYKPTFSVTIRAPHGYVTILAWRIREVAAA